MLNSTTQIQIETVWSLDPFHCSGNPPEPYRCYYCDFKADSAMEYNDHVERTKHENPHTLKKLIPNYTCEKCKFASYSRFLILKHVSTGCKVDRAKEVVMFLYVPASMSMLLKHVYYGCEVDKTKADFLLASLRGEMAQNCKEILYYNSRIWQGISGNTGIPEFTAGLPRVKPGAVKRSLPKPSRPKVAPEREKRKMLCDRCGNQFSSSLTLKNHLIQKHTSSEDIDWFECADCSYKAKVAHELKRHVLERHTDKSKIYMYKCPFCTYSHVRGNCLRQHLKCHDYADCEWFNCKFCPFKTKNKSGVRRHELETHRGDYKRFDCEHCPYQARQKTHLKLHVVQKHTPDEEVEWFRCLHCDYKAKLKASLKTHILRKHCLVGLGNM